MHRVRYKSSDQENHKSHRMDQADRGEQRMAHLRAANRDTMKMLTSMNYMTIETDAGHPSQEAGLKSTHLEPDLVRRAHGSELEPRSHRRRISASSTSTDSVQESAREATRFKWRSIGEELRQISDHFEFKRASSYTSHHQPGHQVIVGQVADSGLTFWGECSKLLLILFLSLSARSARCWRM